MRLLDLLRRARRVMNRVNKEPADKVIYGTVLVAYRKLRNNRYNLITKEILLH